jgi:hypothetical protein
MVRAGRSLAHSRSLRAISKIKQVLVVVILVTIAVGALYGLFVAGRATLEHWMVRIVFYSRVPMLNRRL